MTGRLELGIEPVDRRIPYLSPTERVKRLGSEREELYLRNQTPLATSFMKSCALRAGLADGPVSEDRQPVKNSTRLTLELKEIAIRLGADLVGVSLLDQSYVYLDQELPHSHTITLAQGMDYGFIKTAPSRKSYTEFWRAYNSLAEAAVHLASHIRGMGYSARAHHVRTEDLLLVPGAVDSGLGELSKMGLLMTNRYGPRVRLAAVTTDLPADADLPQDLGMQDFCEKCSKCVRHCPSGAISEKKSWVRGVRKWQTDAERCIDAFSRSFACGLCIRYCPWNKPDTALHRFARAAAVRYPVARSWLVRADDWFYGR